MKSAVVSILLLVPIVYSASKPCTKQDAIAAEEQASSIQSWTELHRSYERYAQCDDGAIGEGYSDSIARLLAEKWESLDEFDRLGVQDRAFEGFVLRHVDELMTPEQANKIRDNSKNHCPSHDRALCRKIADRLRASSGPQRKP